MSTASFDRANLEVKAFDPTPLGTLAACRALDTEDGGLIAQRDTYFHYPRTVLKLRQESRMSWLIEYRRPASRFPARSDYRLLAVEDPHNLRELLTKLYGIRLEVIKQRRVFLWRGVRIHVDSVAGLGDFVELEAVLGPDLDEPEARARLIELRLYLDISAHHLVAGGYAGLLERDLKQLAPAAAPSGRSLLGA